MLKRAIVSILISLFVNGVTALFFLATSTSFPPLSFILIVALVLTIVINILLFDWI